MNLTEEERAVLELEHIAKDLNEWLDRRGIAGGLAHRVLGMGDEESVQAAIATLDALGAGLAPKLYRPALRPAVRMAMRKSDHDLRNEVQGLRMKFEEFKAVAKDIAGDPITEKATHEEVCGLLLRMVLDEYDAGDAELIEDALQRSVPA
jgi:hypothetical protein